MGHPCISTMLITTITQFDDYFFGDFRELPPEQYRKPTPTSKPCYSFHARAPQARDATELQQALEGTTNLLLQYNFTIGFGHPTTGLRPGRPHPGSWDAVTWTMTNRSLKITLNIDRYQPLLRNDMSPSERHREEHYRAKKTLARVHGKFLLIPFRDPAKPHSTS